MKVIEIFIVLIEFLIMGIGGNINFMRIYLYLINCYWGFIMSVYKLLNFVKFNNIYVRYYF